MARDRNPGRLSNWELRCRTCQHLFPDRKNVQYIADHFALVHGTDKLEADLVWAGVGPAPKSQPRWN